MGGGIWEEEAIVFIFAGFLHSREVFGLYRISLVRGFARVEAE